TVRLGRRKRSHSRSPPTSSQRLRRWRRLRRRQSRRSRRRCRKASRPQGRPRRCRQPIPGRSRSPAAPIDTFRTFRVTERGRRSRDIGGERSKARPRNAAFALHRRWFEERQRGRQARELLISALELGMTKRIHAKHKIDRRLGENIWGRPKSPYNKREYGP